MLCIMLAVCSIRDWKTKEIPMLWLVFISIITTGLILCCNTVSIPLRVGGALLGLLFLFISKCTHEAIGYADDWIILILGVYMGALKVMNVLFGASLLACVCSLFYLWRHHWKRSATLPFIPFLTISYLGVLIL